MKKIDVLLTSSEHISVFVAMKDNLIVVPSFMENLIPKPLIENLSIKM